VFWHRVIITDCRTCPSVFGLRLFVVSAAAVNHLAAVNLLDKNEAHELRLDLAL
jgi:LPS sulfotransferase NodH